MGSNPILSTIFKVKMKLMKIVNTNFQDGAYEGYIKMLKPNDLVKVKNMEAKRYVYDGDHEAYFFETKMKQFIGKTYRIKCISKYKPNKKQDLYELIGVEIDMTPGYFFYWHPNWLKKVLDRKLKFKDILKKEEV